ncbi:GPP34 family phosphoprotein [Streptomyces sp.]|uniref:GOLPH3/VPS74 family protein n=1 Tax=Streptomyces sp. TaxID=1931 RepID=UPI0028119FA4|nr:GPP34 family phosphoprotein [Streptomyces sp.]
MTTAKDLFIIAMEEGSEPAVGQGDLSLALAGAELIDLLEAGAVTVDGDVVVPGEPAVPGDRLLARASEEVTRQPPHETIEDWLWRRGRDLAAGYQAALEEDGELTRKRGGRLPFGPERVEPVDGPARRRAMGRWSGREPVLTALASVIGIGDEPTGDRPGFEEEGVTAVVAAVHDAVMELEAVRQRRTIENAAFANLWRGV